MASISKYITWMRLRICNVRVYASCVCACWSCHRFKQYLPGSSANTVLIYIQMRSENESANYFTVFLFSRWLGHSIAQYYVQAGCGLSMHHRLTIGLFSKVEYLVIWIVDCDRLRFAFQYRVTTILPAPHTHICQMASSHQMQQLDAQCVSSICRKILWNCGSNCTTYS